MGQLTDVVGAAQPDHSGADPAFAVDGCLKVPSVLDLDTCTRVAGMLDLALSGAGTRNALAFPWMADIVRQVRSHPAIAPLLQPDAVAVQCTLFRKSMEHNWLVSMHQDLSIPVRERVLVDGLRGWSEKEGGWFVQAPQDVLENLIAVRLHLDDCGADDGPLRVLVGSHRWGVVTPLIASGGQGATRACLADQGDAWIMRPLLLHASSKARGRSARRVLHLLFGPPQLPLGLRWPQAM